MKIEEIIIGSACIFWGIFAFLYRGELYKQAREGGRGLRDIRILKPLILGLTMALPVIGVLLIIIRGL